MSYLRPFNPTPKDLQLTALDSWLQHVFHLIRDNQILSLNRKPVITPSASIQSFEENLQPVIFFTNTSDTTKSNNNNPVFKDILRYVDSFMPISMQEEAFQHGTQMVRKEELFCGLYDLYTPFFYLFWRQEFQLLNIPHLCAPHDRISVLEHILRTAGTSTNNGKFCGELKAILAPCSGYGIGISAVIK